MRNLIKVEYDPIFGCVGWKFRVQPNDKLSKKRKTRNDDGKHNALYKVRFNALYTLLALVN